jgi:hypothetical protein
LSREGVDIGNLLSKAQPLIEKLSSSPYDGTRPLCATDDDIIRSGLNLWGLQETFLNIVEAYIKLPIRYRGLVMRRDVADGKQFGTRHWHYDGEDSRIVKIIVYLNDVTKYDGPYCYIPRNLTKTKQFSLVNGRIPDDAISGCVDESQIVHCIGPRGTVVFTDTCQAIHRGAVPINSDRYTLFYAYNSSKPRRPQYCKPLQPRSVYNLDFLNSRQISTLVN